MVAAFLIEPAPEFAEGESRSRIDILLALPGHEAGDGSSPGRRQGEGIQVRLDLDGVFGGKPIICLKFDRRALPAAKQLDRSDAQGRSGGLEAGLPVFQEVWDPFPLCILDAETLGPAGRDVDPDEAAASEGGRVEDGVRRRRLGMRGVIVREHRVTVFNRRAGPEGHIVRPAAPSVEPVVGYDPAVVVLGEHQGPPGLVDALLVGEPSRLQGEQGGGLFRHQEFVLRFPDLLGKPLQDLRAPDQSAADIFLRHTVFLVGRVRRFSLEILPPGQVGGVLAFGRDIPAQPGAVGPARVLVGHADRPFDAGGFAGGQEVSVAAIGPRLPDRVTQAFAGIAGVGEEDAAVRSDPAHVAIAETGCVPAPAGVGAFEGGIFEAQAAEDSRQAGSEAWLFDGVGQEFRLGEILPYLLHPILQLADDALAVHIVHVGLGIGRVGEFHPGRCREGLEMLQGSRRPHGDGVPGLRLDFQADAPAGMGLQLVRQVIRVGLDGIMPVYAAVEPVHERPARLGGKRREGK